jgi:hypothetical protein
MLAGRNGARGRIRTCTGDALDVVSLLLDCASEMDGASCRCRPGATFLQRKPAGCRKEAKWSQSPVLPWAQQAYETCLSAGSIAVWHTANMEMGPPPGVAPGWPAYRADTSLKMLWGLCKWWGRRVLPSLPLACQTSALLMSNVPVKMERVNGVAPSSRPWQSRILLLNHTRVKWCPQPDSHQQPERRGTT